MRRIRIIIGCCILIVIILGVYRFISHSTLRRVVVIHSYHPTYLGYSRYNACIEREFARAGQPVEITTYYIDCERWHEKQEIEHARRLLDSAALLNPDVILLNDDQGTYSTLKTHHPLLERTPVIFAGVNHPNWELIAEYDNVTGWYDKINYAANVEAVHELTGRNLLFTLMDYTYIDRCIRTQIKEQFRDTPYIFNENYQIDKVVQDSLIKEGRIVLFSIGARPLSDTLQTTFKPGTNLSFSWAITVHNNTPYLQTKFDFTTVSWGGSLKPMRYTAINEQFECGYNFLGGYLTPIGVQAREQVQTAIEILKGTPVSEIPVRESYKDYYLDWKAMQIEGMSLAAVPDKYTILNLPFKERYPRLWYTLVIGGGFLLIILIAGLIYLYKREQVRRRQTFSDLVKERETLSLAIAGSDIFAWYLDGEQLTFGKSFWHYLRQTPYPMHMDGFFSFVHPDFLQLARTFGKRVRDVGKHSVELRVRFAPKDYEWYELPSFRLENPAGERNTTGLLINIEEFKKREQELIETRRLAEKAELKESFLANMSHEIRTPLNAIVGFASLLADLDSELSREDKQSFSETINRNNELLLKLINDILEISRIESECMSFMITDCPIDTLVKEVYQGFRVQVPSHLQFRYEHDEGSIVARIDGSRVKQMLNNFLNNAVKFTHKGSITLGWRRIGDEVELYVEDTGIGIPKSEQKIIFSRFYKQNEFEQGTGLGLSICQLIVEKLHGRLELHSEPNVGSRFSAFFMLKDAKEENPLHESKMHATGSCSPYTPDRKDVEGTK